LMKSLGRSAAFASKTRYAGTVFLQRQHVGRTALWTVTKLWYGRCVDVLSACAANSEGHSHERPQDIAAITEQVAGSPLDCFNAADYDNMVGRLSLVGNKTG